MKVLFIAYQEASNPLMKNSQALPYINGLEKFGVEFVLMTYESEDSLKKSRNFMEAENSNIKWEYEKYCKKAGVLATIIDILKGMLKVVFILTKNKISLIHARSTIAAIISLIPAKMFGVKIFYDTRGLLAEKYVAGGFIKRGCITYRLLKKIEFYLLKKVDYFTVETEKHAGLLKRFDKLLSKKMGVIPCCVDLNRFKLYKREIEFADKHKINNEFVLTYLGKTGTWHLIDKMFDFFMVLEKRINGAVFLFLTQDDPAVILDKAREKLIDINLIKIVKPENEDIPKFLCNSHAGIFFVNPYKGYNSTHIKYSEYLGCGLPVVVNKGIGDTDMLNKKHSVGVNVKEFSDKEYNYAVIMLESMIKRNQNHDELGKRCNEVAKLHYSLDMGVSKYMQIYRNLCH